MSVLIKGMEMPESCTECKVICGLPYQCRDKKGHRPDCPLVPAADVVEVVRCEDCKHCLKEDEYELWCYGRGFPARLVRADDYCSYGADMRGGEKNEV